MTGADIVLSTGNEPTWAPECDWQTIDRALRSIAKRRAGLDAEEARWLRAAEKQQIWWHLGMVSAIDYLERVLGYSPRAAQERLRVARKLGELPETEDELSRGVISFSTARELSRVATRWTESEWLVAASGKNLREVEELVSGHVEGDLPDDPRDERARLHTLSYEVDGETFAASRQLRALIEDELGRHVDDAEFYAVMVARALDGERTRARAQVALTLCEKCGAGWQDGAGAVVRVEPSVVERALCDAEHIGSLDAATPSRAHQDVSPATRRLVEARDHGRCRVPGCRSARGLEVHHIVHREDGRSHEPDNLVMSCSACHKALPVRRRWISGSADELVVKRLGAHVGAPPSRVRDDAILALAGLGWKPAMARHAVGLALTIRTALRNCT